MAQRDKMETECVCVCVSEREREEIESVCCSEHVINVKVWNVIL